MNTRTVLPRHSPGVSRAQAWRSRGTLLLLLLGAALALPPAVAAQPYDASLLIGGFTGADATHGYVRIPHSAALNPTGGFTFEAWVAIRDGNGGDCSSIAGKHYQQAWWVGVCGTDLVSFLKNTPRTSGTIPSEVWTHIAVTFDGANRRHYINGEVVGTFPESGPLSTSTSELRIGSDASWQHTPVGLIDEVRLWSVARTQAQLRAAINLPIAAPAVGLVAVWPFQESFADIVGGHNGASAGVDVGFADFGIGLSCGASTATELCLGGRFVASAKFRTGPPGSAEGTGQTVPVVNPGSGLFWFFSPNNWEVMVKAIDGCGLNSRHWIFSAATTNVFYRLQVFDGIAGDQRIYFNYPGPPAPAVTDTSAFVACP